MHTKGFLLALTLVALLACGGGGVGGSTASTHSISGTVSGDVAAGVTIALGGTSTGSTTTDSSGAYSFSVGAGTYTLTPSLSGYRFSPTCASRTVSADTAGVNFTSTASSSSTLGDRTDYSSVSLTSYGTYSSSRASATYADYLYTSTTADTPAIKVAPGGSLTLSSCKATKSGDTGNTDNSAFYGIDAGVLVSSSSTATSYTAGSAASLTLSDCTIATAAKGANGVFAFGASAAATLDHVTITTTGDNNARGVDATYGGSVTISNSVISTSGDSCAALASDRYSGTSAPTITASNCTGTTAGSGSPGIYCTGTFVVSDCTLSASGSEAAVIEGKNSVTLTDTTLSGTRKWGVMIYQSTSGDSSPGTGSFSMTGGTLTNGCTTGPMFFVCDTTAVITLSGATLVNNDSSSRLLVAGTAASAASYVNNVNSSWGTLGGTVTFTATGQTLYGSILLCDSSSSLAMTLSSSSSLSGAINNLDLAGSCTLTLDSSSSWTATANSFLTTLSGVVLSSGVPTNVNAGSGVTITCGTIKDSSGTSLTGTCTLKGGGTLKIG